MSLEPHLSHGHLLSGGHGKILEGRGWLLVPLHPPFPSFNFMKGKSGLDGSPILYESAHIEKPWIPFFWIGSPLDPPRIPPWILLIHWKQDR